MLTFWGAWTSLKDLAGRVFAPPVPTVESRYTWSVPPRTTSFTSPVRTVTFYLPPRTTSWTIPE